MAKAKDEKKSIEEIMKELDKTYGLGSVIYGDQTEKCTEVVSTGSLSLDIATGIGGIPIDGKIIEIIGWESSGKSTITQTIIGNFQKKYPEKEVILVDGEFSLDEEYATALGIDLKRLILIQLDEGAGEAAYNKVQKLMQSGKIGLVVYDSYNSLQPKKIVDGESGEHNLGLHARMLGNAVMKSNADGVKYKCSSIYLGQLRQAIGVMFGPTEVTQGGNSLKFYSHMRMQISRSTTKDNSVMDGETKMGNLTKVNIIKNKLAPPFKKAEFNIIYGEGIDKYSEIVNLGHDYGIFKKYGESITIDGEKSLIKDFIILMQDNDDLYQEFRDKILNKALTKKEINESKIEETELTGSDTPIC